MAVIKLKNREGLATMRKNHRNLYKEYQTIGPIRAHGRLRPRGVVKYRGHDMHTKRFDIEIPIRDKEQPHFKGLCQAAGSVDVFTVAAWMNENGTIRFEICEEDGYSKPKITTQLPF
jgi:hypothetical protein